MVNAIEKSEYAPLSQDGPVDDIESSESRYRQRPQRFTWRNAAIVILAMTNILCLILLYHSRTIQDNGARETSLTGIHKLPRVSTESEWWTVYSHRNDTEAEIADAAWDAVKPAHGFVAVDPKWAEEKGLMPSMELPSDPSKTVYVLEAYHMLHCLKIMRKTFYQVVRGENPHFALEHTSHCFDAIRQNIMCNADDTLLYTWGRAKAGDGQTRQCRNWNALKNWATENTACYLDHAHKEGGRFWRCDNGEDGLIVGSAKDPQDVLRLSEAER